MPVPPILDIFVVWHPHDSSGPKLFQRLWAHYHSLAFSGLAGGAVEVYPRSAGWKPDDAPRPIGFSSELSRHVPPAQFTVILPVLSRHLARAVQDDGAWKSYIASAAEKSHSGSALVVPLTNQDTNLKGFELDSVIGKGLRLFIDQLSTEGELERAVSQSIAQYVAPAETDEQIRVFISHTKRLSAAESRDHEADIVNRVRSMIGHTKLRTFFDTQDLQPAADWEFELERNAARSALLMVRTDLYAAREWTQREVLIAKKCDLPMVGLYALRKGEERGSFLMDHMPTVPCDPEAPDAGIRLALGKLVDEVLKRALWNAQRSYIRGFDWKPVHSPEPVTIIPWLTEHRSVLRRSSDGVLIIHPDPPLGPKERDVAVELCRLAGVHGDIDIMTPGTFAARGGRLP